MMAPRMSAKSNENMDVITSQALANISGNFQKIFGNIKFSESLQPYWHPTRSVRNSRKNTSLTILFSFFT